MFTRMIQPAILLAVLIALPLSLDASQKNRIALVIGNGNYTDAPLRNPVNDATDMAAALKDLGFRVTLRTDANQRSMEEAIHDFGRRLQAGGVGLFYFAGHGIQYQGQNYLIPVHAEIKSASDVKYEAVDAGRVLTQMEDAGNGLNIIILDACRNNPFARSFRSSEQGLAKMDAPTGSILAYATAPGSVAADGSGRNGLYTEKLLKYMRTPGITVERMFKLVRRDVTDGSGNQQVPWESSSLIGDFHFVPGRGITVTEKTAGPAKAAPLPSKAAPKRLEKITNVLGQDFVYIEPGAFMMGSLLSEKGRMDIETPHRVTLTRGFYLQTTEVTQKQWLAVMGTNPAYFKHCSDDCPIEQVSHSDALQYAHKLSQMSGQRYRLPTEAEWEYAARAGSQTALANGGIEQPTCGADPNLGAMGWYCGNASADYPGCFPAAKWAGTICGGPQQVMRKKPNAWGLYDMHGNVAEWVQDWMADYPTAPVTNPQGPSAGTHRVNRGGGWSSYAKNCRSALRGKYPPGARYIDLGFRLAMDPD